MMDKNSIRSKQGDIFRIILLQWWTMLLIVYDLYFTHFEELNPMNCELVFCEKRRRTFRAIQEKINFKTSSANTD